VEKLNLARLQFVVYIAHICRPFLVRLQARRPLAHELYDLCGSLYNRLAENVIKPENMPKKTEDIAAQDLEETGCFKVPREAGFVGQLTDTLASVSGTRRKELYKEMVTAVVIQLKYLQSHLPYENQLIRAVSFMNPDSGAARTSAVSPTRPPAS
jgi:hypothetical protein